MKIRRKNKKLLENIKILKIKLNFLEILKIYIKIFLK